MKTHLVRGRGRTMCGKSIYWSTETASKVKDATCKTCVETYNYENGITNEYRIGGNFDKSGKERKRKN